MNFVLSIFGVASALSDVSGAMKFADDNRPIVSYEKHIKYQKMLGEETGKKENKLINYNVLLDASKHDVVLDQSAGRYYIAEPNGFEGEKMKFKARAWCENPWSKCHSFTQDYQKLGY